MTSSDRPLNLIRFLGFSLGVALTTAAVDAALNRGQITSRPTGVDAARALANRLEIVRGYIQDDSPEVVFLGDSTATAYPSGASVPDQLAAALATRTSNDISVLDLAGGGLSSFEYFPFSSRIAEMRPDAVVLGFNLQTLSAQSQRSTIIEETMGWLRARDLARAIRQQLDWWGLRFDSLVLHAAIVRSGQTEAWSMLRQHQARIRTGLAGLRFAVQDEQGALRMGSDGLPIAADAITTDTRSQILRRELEARYLPAVTGVTPHHPVLALLGDVIETVTASKTSVVVYVVPCDVEQLTTVGLVRGAGLESTLRSTRSVVEDAGGTLLDLHALFPHTAFRDDAGHLAIDGVHDATRVVAEHLAMTLSP